MPLDTARANTKTDALNDAFAAIGHAPGTAMPRAAGNREPLAWEYFVASHLARRAESRRKKAHAEAVKAGVLFDHAKSPEPPGTNRVVYAGSVVEISLAVASPVAGIDHDAFVADLLAAGVKLALVNRLTAKHATESRPAHKFSSSLVTG